MTEPFRGCPVDALRRGVVEVVPMSADREGRPREALVLLDHDARVRVYLNRCEHLPIPLDGGSRRFLSDDGRHLFCGTHGARYRLEDGFCVEGPCAGRSLLALPFRIDDDGCVVLVVEE